MKWLFIMSQCLDEAADAMVEMVKGVKNADLKSMGAYSMIHPSKKLLSLDRMKTLISNLVNQRPEAR